MVRARRRWRTRPGRLFLYGGGEVSPEVADAFLGSCGGKNAAIIVLPTASDHPKTGPSAVELLRERGATDVYLFTPRKPTVGDLHDLAERMETATGLWMTGGVQTKLVRRLGLHWLREHVRPRVAAGMSVFGTSAGAMATSSAMIAGPGRRRDTSKIGEGIGLTRWVVDTHFAEREREHRLHDALDQTGATRGVGINEREWIVVQGEKILERHGSPTILDRTPRRERRWAWLDLRALARLDGSTVRRRHRLGRRGGRAPAAAV